MRWSHPYPRMVRRPVRKRHQDAVGSARLCGIRRNGRKILRKTLAIKIGHTTLGLRSVSGRLGRPSIGGGQRGVGLVSSLRWALGGQHGSFCRSELGQNLASHSPGARIALDLDVRGKRCIHLILDPNTALDLALRITGAVMRQRQAANA
jgi:hypothetical protein